MDTAKMSVTVPKNKQQHPETSV